MTDTLSSDSRHLTNTQILTFLVSILFASFPSHSAHVESNLVLQPYWDAYWFTGEVFDCLSYICLVISNYLHFLAPFLHRTHPKFVRKLSTYALPLMNLGLSVLQTSPTLKHAKMIRVMVAPIVASNLVSIQTYAVPTLIMLGTLRKI